MSDLEYALELIEELSQEELDRLLAVVVAERKAREGEQCETSA